MKFILERPLVFIALSYALGIVVQNSLGCWISRLVFAGLVLFSFIPLFVTRSPKIFLALSFVFLISVGALSSHFNQMRPFLDVSNPSFHGKGSLEGRIVSEVNQKQKGKKSINSFTLETESWWRSRHKIRLTGKVQVTLLNAREVPSYRDQVRLFGTLSVPKSAVNPGEFDYRDYLSKQNIHAAFLGFGKKSVRVIESRPSLIGKIFKLRRAIHDRVYQLAPFPEREILLSLITGERTNIPKEVNDDFVRTGTVHVLAISGFQVSLVAGAAFLFLRAIGLSMKFAAFLSACLLMIYVPLAGWQVPVQRAGVMGLVVLGSIILVRSSDVISSLFLALLVLLLVNPSHLYSIAFQLSFISVLALMSLTPRFNEWLKVNGGLPEFFEKVPLWHKILRAGKIMFSTTLAAFIGTWPLVLYYFHTISFTSLLANFLIVPLTTLALFSLIFVLGISCVWITAAQALIAIPVMMIELSLNIAHLLARFPPGFLYSPSPHWSAILAYYLLLCAFVFGIPGVALRWMKKIYGLGFITVLLGLIIPLFHSTDEIVILNVPGSSVIFAEDRLGHRILINGGRGDSKAQDYWTVIPFLKSRGIRELDTIFVTSPERKFWSGLLKIVEHTKVRSLAMPWPYSRETDFQSLIRKIRSQGGRIEGLVPGSRFLFSESLKLEDITSEGLKSPDVSTRVKSSVIQLSHHQFSLVLCEEKIQLGELEKIEIQPEILYADGERMLGEETLSKLLRMRPRVFILANGSGTIGNKVRNQMTEHGVRFLNLKETGALTLRSTQNGFEIIPYVTS